MPLPAGPHLAARRRRGAAHCQAAERLTRDGYVVFHDLAVPGSPANVDHLVIGTSGVFGIVSKQWTGSVHQGSDGLAWHNHDPGSHPGDGPLGGAGDQPPPWPPSGRAAVRPWRSRPRWRLDAHGIAIVPGGRLREALGHDQVLSDGDVVLLAATAQVRLRPAA
jgi:hypothetical protein